VCVCVCVEANLDAAVMLMRCSCRCIQGPGSAEVHVGGSEGGSANAPSGKTDVSLLVCLGLMSVRLNSCASMCMIFRVWVYATPLLAGPTDRSKPDRGYVYRWSHVA